MPGRIDLAPDALQNEIKAKAGGSRSRAALPVLLVPILTAVAATITYSAVISPRRANSATMV